MEKDSSEEKKRKQNLHFGYSAEQGKSCYFLM